MASQRQAIHRKMEEIRARRAKEKAQEVEYAISEGGEQGDAQEGGKVVSETNLLESGSGKGGDTTSAGSGT